MKSIYGRMEYVEKCFSDITIAEKDLLLTLMPRKESSSSSSLNKAKLSGPQLMSPDHLPLQEVLQVLGLQVKTVATPPLPRK